MENRLDHSLLGVLWNQLKEFILFYIGAGICLYGTHWIGVKLPFLAKDLVDMVDNDQGSIDVTQFLWLALGIIFFRTSSRLLFFFPARVQQKKLRVELLARIEKVSPTRYRKYSPGQLFQIMGDDLEQIRALVGFALLQVGNIIIAMSVLLPKIIGFNAKLTLALIPLLIAFTLFTFIVASNKKYFKITQDLQGEVKNFLMESYEGKQTIKNYHAEDSFISIFRKHSYKELYNFYKSGVSIGISIPFIPLGVGASLIWGAVIIQDLNLGASSLVLFSGFIFLFLEPLMFLSWIGVVFARSQGSWVRIRGLVKELETKSPIEHELERKNQNESDSTTTVSLWEKSVRLNIPENSTSIIIGQTGHGKTEILKQIAQVTKNRQVKLSYVAQAPYLYNDSVEANIFLGREKEQRDLEAASALLALFDLSYLAESPEVLLSMEVGENGKKLSGGQAKRLCLVRSLMSEADFIIWDDPFSSVDVISEKNIIQALKEKGHFDNKTILMTGHRLTTVRSCDYLFFIDKEDGLVSEGAVSEKIKVGSEVYEFFEGQVIE